MQTERKSGRVTENVELKTAELERINCTFASDQLQTSVRTLRSLDLL